MYTYETTDTGFKIFKDGTLVINQYHDPAKPSSEAIAESERATKAEAMIAQLQASDAVEHTEEKRLPF
ncbi:hypothetical protein [Idiomarina piscisalsi]|uniref:Uncharacterized protein n=1 Tax=Idiomarina piscisalsi TaxID=1096243 RepID=A0A432YXF3_9GAMM|nr:hypothetical protein [Idiomarina piscisalsi]RUO67981.1 hypothetical protein CWI73_03755 [Idiomarina piscisalsi]